MKKQYRPITFTANQLQGEPGCWKLRKQVDGREIKRTLTDPALKDRREAEREARRIVEQARGGEYGAINALKLRRDIALIGEVIAVYLTTARLQQVSTTTRRNNVRRLRRVIRDAMKHLGQPLPQRRIVDGELTYPEDKLPTDVLTWELADAFKQYRLENAVPRTGVIDPRRPCDEPVPGKLQGTDLERVMRSANSTLGCAQDVFSGAALLESSGAYAGLKLPDLAGFKKEPEFVTNQADQYLPPDDAVVARVTDGMAELEAGTLCNTETTQCRAMLVRRPGRENWVAKWRTGPEKFRTRGTDYEATESKRGAAQKAGDEWAKAEGYFHADGRCTTDGSFVFTHQGRRRRVNQWNAWVAMSLALEMGLRLQEIAEARYSQISVIDGQRFFTCTSTATYRGTKSRRDRSVPFPEWLWEALNAHRLDGEFLIAGSANYRRKVLGREVAAVMRHFGWRRVECIHELRKIFASDYGREVKDPIAVKDVLGHRSLKTTMRYLALSEQPQKKTSRRVRRAA